CLTATDSPGARHKRRPGPPGARAPVRVRLPAGSSGVNESVGEHRGATGRAAGRPGFEASHGSRYNTPVPGQGPGRVDDGGKGPTSMRILILGGDGYLGWPTAMHFSKRGHEVHAIDNYLRRRA